MLTVSERAGGNRVAGPPQKILPATPCGHDARRGIARSIARVSHATTRAVAFAAAAEARDLEVTTVSSIAEIDKLQWDACALGSGVSNPFISWDFLNALEQSGSVHAKKGWLPTHAVLSDAKSGEIMGVSPLYLKGHSYGEYVFDRAWANAYDSVTGKRYYPKLQSCVPFSPVTGSRLLAKKGPDREKVLQALAQSMMAIADEVDVSSLHITFNTAEENKYFSGSGFLRRSHLQYHFENKFETFEDFLMSLRQRKRKAIRQERKAVQNSGLKVYRVYGSEMNSKDWDIFYKFYRNTCDDKWGEAYLNRSFFHLLGETMPEKVMVVFVEDENGEKIAGALNLVGSDTLYGRNWGCKRGGINGYGLQDKRVKHLHFEVCYYQALEAAIDLGLSRVEAGAQGEHKIQRGYLPTLTHSAHYVKDSRMKALLSDFLRREKQEVDYMIDVMNQKLSPYKDA